MDLDQRRGTELIICPTIQYLNFEDGPTFGFNVQVGSTYLGWDAGGRWGFVIYGRANGAPLDFEQWYAYATPPNNFLRLPEESIFLGVSTYNGDILFLSTKGK